jgi:hypothetical protein
LLGLSRDSAPWHVGDGAAEGCDLVAEWRIVDAQWSGVFFAYGLSKVFRIKLKFDEAAHEVRNLSDPTATDRQAPVTIVSERWMAGTMAAVLLLRITTT